MKPTFWQRLDLLARNLTPFALTLLLLVIGLVPLHLPGFSRVAPMLALAAVYHWSIYRPDLLPASAVFVLGVLQDLLAGAPVGLHAVIFLAVFGLVASQRRFLVRKPFVLVWLGFALVGIGATLGTWLLLMAYHWTLVSPRPAAYQYLLTVGLYPALAWLFLRWQQAFLKVGVG
jgi:rod shape-determining protein MreD